ncbi:MAG: hypothetical protein HQ478_08250 [Chloroflexi bacterium]|nr:hypothetical protein [Chloroflexota bacterium]
MAPRLLLATMMAVVVLVSVVFGAPARAAGFVSPNSAALFGTVIGVGSSSLSVATDDGIIELFVTDSTTITSGQNSITLTDVREGDRIASTAIAGPSGGLISESLLIRPRSGLETRHIVGVVIELGDSQITLVDRDDNTVTVDLSTDVGQPAIGDALTIVARKNSLTDGLTAIAIENLENSIARLETLLAQAERSTQTDASLRAEELRGLLQENGRRHLTALQRAFERTHGPEREAIRANLLRLHSAYSLTAGREGLSAPGISSSGLVVSVNAGQLILTDDNGIRVAFSLTASTRYLLEDDSDVRTFGPTREPSISPGDRVLIEFSPLDDSSSPQASKVRIEQPVLTIEEIDALQQTQRTQFVGVITRFDEIVDQDIFTAALTLTDQITGEKLVLKTTTATGILLNGNESAADALIPGLGVAIDIDASGLVATRIDAFPRVDREQHVRGVVRRVDSDHGVLVIAPERGDPVVLTVTDEVSVEKDGIRTRLAGLQVGDHVLNSTRFDSEAGSITNLVIRSPEVEFKGTVRGINPEAHKLTVELPDGDAILLSILAGTEFTGGNGLRSAFGEIIVGDVVRQGEFRTVSVDGIPRSVASLLVVQSAKLIRTRGTVVGVDSAGGLLVVDSISGKVLNLNLPGDDRRISLVKDSQPIESLESVNVGDIVGLVVYLEESDTIVSLSVVTAGARSAHGRIASFNEAGGLVTFVTRDLQRLSLRIVDTSRLVRNGEPARSRQFNTSDLVQQILYRVDPDGTIDGELILLQVLGGRTAQQISGNQTTQPSQPVFAEVRLDGTAVLVNGNTWEIDGRTVVLSPRTEITGRLEDGAFVSIVARGLGDGRFEALTVTVTAPPSQADNSSDEGGLSITSDAAIEVQGVIDFVEDNTIFADGRRLLITSDTVVVGKTASGAEFSANVTRADDGSIVILSLTVHAR